MKVFQKSPKTGSQFRSACQKIRDKSLVIKSEGLFGLCEGENAGKVGTGTGEIIQDLSVIMQLYEFIFDHHQIQFNPGLCFFSFFKEHFI